MLFPLYDESAPLLKPPFVTLALILLNFIIFAVTILSSNPEQIILNYGLVPENILTGQSFLTLLTSLFLHGGLLHLIGNMWFLWLFGDNVEENLGAIRFIIFYLVVGVVASLIHIFTISGEDLNIPMIGASGAISGLLGGYMVVAPRNRIRTFFILIFRPYFFYIPAYFYIAIWFIYQLLYIGTPTSIAYMAHIGGFIAGLILILLVRRKFIRRDYYLAGKSLLIRRRGFE